VPIGSCRSLRVPGRHPSAAACDSAFSRVPIGSCCSLRTLADAHQSVRLDNHQQAYSVTDARKKMGNPTGVHYVET
jgi:hypothetical protein